MIRTDRNYNNTVAFSREELIAKYEAEHDELAELMFDFPSMCTEENINRLNYLASQTEIMKGNEIYHY